MTVHRLEGAEERTRAWFNSAERVDVELDGPGISSSPRYVREIQTGESFLTVCTQRSRCKASNLPAFTRGRVCERPEVSALDAAGGQLVVVANN